MMSCAPPSRGGWIGCQALENCQRLLAPRPGHEDVVVVIGGHDIGADAGFGQRGGDGGGEADGRQRGMNRQAIFAQPAT